MERLFKVLADDGSAHHGGSGKWHLPVGDKPGKWMPAIRGELRPCERGYHLCRATDLVYWLGPTIFEAEYDGGDRVDVNDRDPKVVVRKARLMRRLDNWNDRTMRLFAVECAERVLPIYERDYPDDKRPREALEVARRFANGEATAEQLAAARAAAWDASWDAAWAASWDAAGDASWDAAWAAAGDAAWAAWDAAWDAARDAAGDAERTWQTERLLALLGIADGATV